MKAVQAYIELCENLDPAWDPKVGTWAIDKFTQQGRLIYGYDSQRDKLLLAHPGGDPQNFYSNDKSNLVPLYATGYIVGPGFFSKICDDAGIKGFIQGGGSEDISLC